MKLNVLERAMILGLLPEKGDYATFRAITDARYELSLKEDEIKEFEYKLVTNAEGADTMQWNAKGSADKDIKLSDLVIDIVKEAMKKLNDEKSLTMNHISLYEKLFK